jgi:hypothetical protein
MKLTDARKDKLIEIAGKNGGRLTAEAIVEDARNPESILHECFEWDDSIAAELYRIEQARAMVRSVRVETVTEGGNSYMVPVFIRDPESEPREQGYVGVETVRARHEEIDALKSEIARAAGILERIVGLAVALGLDAEVAQLLSAFDGLRKVVKLKAV